MSNRQNYCNTNCVFGSPLLSEVCTKPSQPIGDDPIPIPLCWMSHFIVFSFQLIFRNLHSRLRIPHRYPTDTPPIPQSSNFVRGKGISNLAHAYLVFWWTWDFVLF